MHRQKSLPLGGEQALDRLWEGFPEQAREEVVEQFARLLAATLRSEAAPAAKGTDVGQPRCQGRHDGAAACRCGGPAPGRDRGTGTGHR